MLGLSLGLTPGNPLFRSGGETDTFANWVPYGSDSGLVYRNSLKVAGTTAMSTNGLTATIKGDAGGPTHSATKGMTATNGTDSCYHIGGLSAGQKTALTAGGQITFQVETVGLCALDANATGSAGLDQSAALAYLFSFNNDSNSNNSRISFRRQSNEAATVLVNGSLGSSDSSNGVSFRGWTALTMSGSGASTAFWNSYRYPTYRQFTTVNVGWYTDGADRRVILSIDGNILATVVRIDVAVNPFDDHFILGGQGNYFFGPASPEVVAGSYWNTSYFRNVQLSSTAPVAPAESGLGNVAILSDSIIGSYDWFVDARRDISIIARINRAVELRGKKLTTVYRMNMGGHQMDDTGAAFSFTNGSNSSADQTIDNTPTAVVSPRTTCKAQNAKTIIINGGSNDINDGNTTTTSFRDALRDHLKFFLGLDNSGWGGTDYSASPPGATIAYIFVTNICDRGIINWNDTNRAKAATFRTVIDQVVADFPVAYPGSSCIVRVIDTFNGMGGTDQYTGKIQAIDDVHPDYAGVVRLGDTIGSALSPYA